MKLFDLATWASVVILVVGATVIFLWFLRDAGKVLRGDGGARAEGREESGESGEKGEPAGHS